MSKGLEALNSLFETMPFAFLESNTMKELKIIEKELKALEIIKKKDIHKTMLSLTQSADEYNHFIDDVSEEMQLTDEEYDLLKEALEDGN